MTSAAQPELEGTNPRYVTIIDRSITIDECEEWQQKLEGFQKGDLVRITADGDSPFYFDFVTPEELAERTSKWDGETTTFKGRYPRIHVSAELPGLDSTKNRIVVVSKRSVDAVLDVDVLVEVCRASSPSPMVEAGVVPRPMPTPLGPPEELPRGNRNSGFFAKGTVIVVGLPLYLIALFVANYFALRAAGASALPDLLVGDGTLALATATFVSITLERSGRHLQNARQRRRSGIVTK